MSDIAKRLLQGGCMPRSNGLINTLALEIGCEEAVITAVINVESNGRGYDKSGRVKLLFEKHKFYKYLSADKRGKAIKAGLARKKWISPANGGYAEQKTNYQALKLLIAAMNIDEDAALKSASYGAGQILGENYGLAGFSNVQDFVLNMCASEDAQIIAMFGFIQARGLTASLRDKDFDAIARIYNGSGQVKIYGNKMREAYHKIAGVAAVIDSSVRASGLRLGSKGYRVTALQNRLTELGYMVAVDGDYGPATRRAIIAFQADYDQETDGVVGPKTQHALDIATIAVDDAREATSMQDLRKKGTTIVKQSDKSQMIGSIAIAGASLKGADEMGVLDTAKDYLSEFVQIKQSIMAPLSTLTEMLTENWWLIALIIGVFLYVLSWRIKREYLKDHQTGRIV